MFRFLGSSNKLKERKLRKTTIEEFRNQLKDLKNILNEIKKLELLRQQEINEIKNETERQLSMLNDEMSNVLDRLEVNLTTVELRRRFYEKPHESEKERELRLSTKEKINEIKGLKEEVEDNKEELLDCLLDGESKISKLLTDLKYEKHGALHDITILESKLKTLEILPAQIDRIKE